MWFSIIKASNQTQKVSLTSLNFSTTLLRNTLTGLPHVNFEKMKTIFSKYEKKDFDENGKFSGGVECTEFAMFMSEIHELAMGKQGRQPIEHCDMASIILAQKLIDAHDDNDDNMLEWNELKMW